MDSAEAIVARCEALISQIDLPSLDPELVKRTLGCARVPSAYEDPREKEAEYIGARLLDRAFRWRGGDLAPDAPDDLVRLDLALGAPRSRCRAGG